VKVVLATSNPGKQREFAAMLAARGFELVMQSELGIAPIEETGKTFEENALLKARHASEKAHMPALADDSGLEVDALGGQPGLHSAYFAGPKATDAENNAALIKALAGVPPEKRTARYRCVLALVRNPKDNCPLIAQGSWEGHIALEPRGTNGFGYDPYFIPEGSNCTSAEMSPALKNALSHRSAALRELIVRLDTCI
jgi:XTP/dITP diphosphohydrolase